MSVHRGTIPAEEYDTTYFLRECEGYEEYLRSGGTELPRCLLAALALAGDLKDVRLLDVGCGRGELLRYAANQGAIPTGLDYSMDALKLAAPILDGTNASLLRANVRQLPFVEGSFDLILALDLVEHLHPHELDDMLREAYRLLVPGGRLIVHTMPNLWYYRYGYPLFRAVQRLRGVQLPRDPHERSRRVHVNVQSLTTLSGSLRRAGFRARVWLQDTQEYKQESNRVMRFAYRVLASVYPLRWIFCNDLFAVATRES